MEEIFYWKKCSRILTIVCCSGKLERFFLTIFQRSFLPKKINCLHNFKMCFKKIETISADLYLNNQVISHQKENQTFKGIYSLYFQFPLKLIILICIMLCSHRYSVPSVAT